MPLNILVCMKQVPDTETKVRVQEKAPKIDSSGVKYIINPYDEFAIEEALRIKEKFGGSVTVLTAGPPRAEDALRTAIAMGADNAIHIKEPAFEDNDSLSIAKILKKCIESQKLPYDLILAGRQAIDDDSWQCSNALAELLNLPSVSMAIKLEISQDMKKVKINRPVEGGEEVIESSLPVVISVTKGINVPRYPTLPNIMKAKKKEIKVLNLASLGLSQSDAGENGSMTKIVEMTLPPSRKAGKVVDGTEPDKAVRALIEFLKNDAKII